HHQDVGSRHWAVCQPVHRRGAWRHDSSRAQSGPGSERPCRAAVRRRLMSDDPVVYVIDDDASFRKAVSRLLGSAGIEVEALASAREFLDRPAADRPSCLVLDVRMPGPSGMDLQSALAEAGREIPIVFMTGHGDFSTSVRAMKGGAVDFLEKPFRAPELLACVERGLARSRQSRVERAAREVVERRFASLTLRERDVLRLVVTGMLNKQI